MNQRENFYAMIRGEKPEFITATGMYNKMCLMPLDPESPQFLEAQTVSELIGL